MSNLFGSKPPRDEGRSLPQGETVGRYTAYLDAQKAVDYLADSKFPVQMVSIIGNELKSVERVTGRLSYPKVALSSAATGAWFGLFVGLALMLFAGGESYVSLIPSMALGAVFWLLFGILAYALQRGRRDFTSTSQVVATSYDVIVSAKAAPDARRLLQQLPMVGQHGHPQPYQGAPPYQSQPGQQGGQGPAPERPATWANPYGAATGNQPNPNQPNPNQPVPAGQEAAAPGAAGTETGAAPRGHFPDLPDGRPQYGVRLPEAQEQPAEEQHAKSQGAESATESRPPEPVPGAGDDTTSKDTPGKDTGSDDR